MRKNLQSNIISRFPIRSRMLLQTSPGNQDPFDYLIKQHPSPIDLPKRYRQTCPPRISQEPVGSADAEFFKASRVSRSGVGRVDNGRPILKVTLYVAENPGDRVAHNFLDTPGYLAPPTCSPSPPPPHLWREDTRRNPPPSCSWPFQKPGRAFVPFAWTKMDTAIRGSLEEEIPDSRRRYLGRSVTGHVSSSRRQRTTGEGKGGREEGPSRRWTGWKSVEITGALPFFLLRTANRKRIIGRLIGYSG